MGFSAAYIAEIVRGGLQAVPTGQTEAAQALGLSPGSMQRLIVLPQALRAVIPAMVGQFIALFKDTTAAHDGRRCSSSSMPRRSPTTNRSSSARGSRP